MKNETKKRRRNNQSRYNAEKKRERAERIAKREEISLDDAYKLIEWQERKFVISKTSKSKIKAARKQDRKSSVKIKLISKRGIVVKGKHVCAKCKKSVNNPTKYSESNIGAVLLCAPCKSRVRKASFGSDGKFTKVVSGGGGPGTGKKR